MAQKPNTIIHKTFTYDCPDDYLSTVRTLGKTGTWTYDGPDRIWLLVDNDDLKIHSWKDDMEDGEDYPTPINMTKVLLDCEQNPLLATLVGADQIRDYAMLDQHVEELPCGGTYSRPLVPPPDHTYELDEILYNPATGTFTSPFPWKKPHVDWADGRAWRNKWLELTDDKDVANTPDLPPALAAQWAEHRQMLRDLPQTYGATNTHITIDLTATSPVNTAGQKVIQLTTVDGINPGDDVGVRGWPVENIFTDHTTVVSVNTVSKQVTLDKNLIATPTEANSELAFSPCPFVEPWKIAPVMGPDGKG